VKAALGLMMKEELVAEIERGRYAPRSALKLTGGKVYEVLVEKIYPGSAVVRINDKWRARLDPYEYNGPRNLIKKDSTFKAVADLYRMNGTLCIRIKEVTQKL
jgi:Fanconi anemia group M protein